MTEQNKEGKGSGGIKDENEARKEGYKEKDDRKVEYMNGKEGIGEGRRTMK